MTTVAFDGVSICADSLVTANGWRYGYVKKIRPLGGADWAAFAGDLGDCNPVLSWLEGGCLDNERPELGEDVEFEILWLRDGQPWLVDNRLSPYEVSVPCVIGSGSEFAATAMVLGLSARGAVSAAIKMDIRSGGDIQEVFI